MNRPAAVNVDEASPFEAQAFFEAIPSDPERAMALLRTQVPSDGPPTPRAAVFLENGEWDDSTTIAVTFVSWILGKCSTTIRNTDCTRRLFGVVMFLNLISFDVSICTMKV